MRIRSLVFTVAVITAMVFGLAGVTQPVEAVAYGSSFVTSITYMNVGSDTASISMQFYAAGSSSPITISRDDLAQYAASSLYVGSLDSISSGFQGSGIISSSQPLAATLVQVPGSSSTVKNRPLSNGSATGSAVVTIPTALKNSYSTTSLISIQNVDSTAADLTVEFIPTSGSTISTTVEDLPSGSSQYYDLGSTDVLTDSTFNGSIRVTAKQAGTDTDGSVIAVSMEMSTTGDNTYSFEGVSESGNTIYMPSAFCNWGSGYVNSAYAIQNASDSESAAVTVTYSSGEVDGPYTIAAGTKQSIQGCTVNATGFLGAATITSDGGEISVIGKITGGGLSTAYNGFNQGYSSVVLPYVRYTTSYWTDSTRQRVFIAIQNVGDEEIPAGGVVATYYDYAGNVSGTTTNPSAIAIGGKWSTDASTVNSEFGYVGSTGGGAIITTTNSSIAVIARAQTYLTSSTTSGEDYNGIEYTTP